MQCPKCQFENPEGIKFCGECGAKLERICSSCNSSNPLQFKFCGECGHKLEVPVERPQKDLSFDEKINKIQKYLPKGLTEKILSQRDRIEGEFFCGWLCRKAQVVATFSAEFKTL